MALGVYTFYGSSIADHYRIGNQQDYLLGQFVGDDYADEEFASKIKRVVKRLAERLGFGNFNYCWSPFKIKPYKPLSSEQKYKRMVSKTYNEHKKSINKIINANTLFVDDFLSEEQKKLHNRIEVLKNRYNQ